MTNREAVIDGKKAGKSNTQIAKELGVSRQSVDMHVSRMKAGGIYPIPEGHSVKGVSTLYNSEGEMAAQWVKTRVDEGQQQLALDAAVKALCERVKPQARIPRPKGLDSHLCNLYTITDYHMGMLAWKRETGDDWDVRIAENLLVAAFAQMVKSAPAAKVGVVNQLGDFLHYDSMAAITPTSHNVLDSDSRFAKVVECSIRVLRKLVNMALEKHERVHVVMAEGNHDIASSVWLREIFSALYENEPRVTVDKSPLPYYAFQHGKAMLCFHHGHLSKVGELPLLFAAQFPKMWGDCTKRYAHTGHLHHVHEKEHPGIVITQHQTLAARDAYAARGGWIADRSAQAITYHDQFGEVGRVRVSPEMLI
jgi:biotin operon repressor